MDTYEVDPETNKKYSRFCQIHSLIKKKKKKNLKFEIFTLRLGKKKQKKQDTLTVQIENKRLVLHCKAKTSSFR